MAIQSNSIVSKEFPEPEQLMMRYYTWWFEALWEYFVWNLNKEQIKKRYEDKLKDHAESQKKYVEDQMKSVYTNITEKANT